MFYNIVFNMILYTIYTSNKPLNHHRHVVGQVHNNFITVCTPLSISLFPSPALPYMCYLYCTHMRTKMFMCRPLGGVQCPHWSTTGGLPTRVTMVANGQHTQPYPPYVPKVTIPTIGTLQWSLAPIAIPLPGGFPWG